MATFKLRANELTGETGLSVYLYPVGGTIANSGGDTLTESSGLFTATVAESLSGLHDYFIYQGGLSIYRGLVFCSGSTWIADDFSWVTSKTDALPSDPADQSVLAGLLATISSQTGLIGTGSALVASPVTPQGKITQIFIGDDYLDANGRSFQWTITEPTGFTAGTSTCSFGGSNGTDEWLVSGTITDNGSTWTLKFDMTKTDTAIETGNYDWTVEVKSATNVEHTVSFGGDTRLRRKYT